MKFFNYIGPLNSTGYGNASLGLLSALLKQNPSISFTPIGRPDTSLEGASVVLPALENKPKLDHPTFCFWHFFDMAKQIENFTGPKVGYSTFEFDSLHPQDTQVFDRLDILATASNWGKNVISKYTNKPVEVIRHAFKKDTNHIINKIDFNYQLNYNAWSTFIAPIKVPPDTLFLSTAGKFESRKGHPELIQACIEYGETKPIVLVSFFYNPFLPYNFPYSFINSNMFYSMFTNSGIKVYKKNNFYLILMPPSFHKKDFHTALSKTHFFISPSKGEGWNLPLFEMMSYGMPSIATINTAHQEYCSLNNVIPILTNSLCPAKDGVFFNGQANWHDVRKEHILESIKKANYSLENKSVITSLQDLSIESTHRFTWEKEARNLQNLMNQF